MDKGPPDKIYLNALRKLRRGEFDAVEAMLQAEPGLFQMKSFDETLLQFCVIENDIDAVKFLLAKGANLEEAEEGDETPLMDAVVQTNPEMLALLLRHGADPNVRSDVLGWALEYAIDRSNYDAMMLLLRHGADTAMVPDFAEIVSKSFSGEQREEILDLVKELKHSSPN